MDPTAKAREDISGTLLRLLGLAARLRRCSILNLSTEHRAELADLALEIYGIGQQSTAARFAEQLGLPEGANEGDVLAVLDALQRQVAARPSAPAGTWEEDTPAMVYEAHEEWPRDASIGLGPFERTSRAPTVPAPPPPPPAGTGSTRRTTPSFPPPPVGPLPLPPAVPRPRRPR